MMMERRGCFLFSAIVGLSVVVLVSSTSISDGIFDSQISTGRNLLQAKKACPVNFEFMNYTIITSRCKGPRFPADSCCSAFKDFACPYADEINDLTTECASTMFSYINLYGKYPPGLFASECREGKEGLACPDSPSQSENSTSSNSMCSPSPLLLVMICFLVFLLKSL